MRYLVFPGTCMHVEHDYYISTSDGLHAESVPTLCSEVCSPGAVE